MRCCLLLLLVALCVLEQTGPCRAEIDAGGGRSASGLLLLRLVFAAQEAGQFSFGAESCVEPRGGAGGVVGDVAPIGPEVRHFDVD